MFKLIDGYIIKRYLTTFFVMLLLFIPIGIMVDVAEKIDKFKENEIHLVKLLVIMLTLLGILAIFSFPFSFFSCHLVHIKIGQ